MIKIGKFTVLTYQECLERLEVTLWDAVVSQQEAFDEMPSDFNLGWLHAFTEAHQEVKSRLGTHWTLRKLLVSAQTFKRLEASFVLMQLQSNFNRALSGVQSDYAGGRVACWQEWALKEPFTTSVFDAFVSKEMENSFEKSKRNVDLGSEHFNFVVEKL